MRQQTKRISLPRPLDHQLEVLRSPSRMKVLACGRRWGKTVLALLACVQGHGPDGRWRGALNGGNVLWVAPTFGISAEIWRYLKRSTEGAWTAKSEVEHRIDLPGGGAITVRSADDPDSLRGSGYDGVVLDESAFCLEETWTQAIRPTLADRQGWAILISTPRGLNWFHRLFLDAENMSDWERWQQPTSANPKIAERELAEMRAGMDSHSHSQEILAQFVSSSGSRIQKEHFRYYKFRGTNHELLTPDENVASIVAETDVTRYAFVDPAGSSMDVQRERRGKQRSWTVIATFDIVHNTGELLWVDVDRFQAEIPDVCHRIKRAYERNKPVWVGIEDAGLGKAVFQSVRREALTVRALKPGGKDKIERATKALVALENGKVFHPHPTLGKAWLKPLEDELLLWTGHTDDVADQVDVLAYAAMEADSSFKNVVHLKEAFWRYDPAPPRSHDTELRALGF